MSDVSHLDRHPTDLLNMSNDNGCFHLWIESLGVSVRAFDMFTGVEMAVKLEEGLDDGGGGDLVDEAAKDLMRSGHEELAQLCSLHLQEVVINIFQFYSNIFWLPGDPCHSGWPR